MLYVFATALVLLPNFLAGDSPSLRVILGHHYTGAFPEGWNRNCGYSRSCCEIKKAGEYLLGIREGLYLTPEPKTLGELQGDYDRLVGRIILAKGLESISQEDRELFGFVAQAMNASENPLTFSGDSHGYLQSLGEYFRCSSNTSPMSRPCQLLSSRDVTAVKGFINISRIILENNEGENSLTTEGLAHLENRREIIRDKIIRIKEGPNYRDYSLIIEEDILPRILRDCEINQDDVTVKKICSTDTPFGEIQEFSGDLKKILAFLRIETSRLRSSRQKSIEEEQKRLSASRVQRFLQSRRTGYYRGGRRVGRRPTGGELAAGAIKESLPNITHTVTMGIFRPNYQSFYNQAIYSKNQGYLYQLMANQTPEFFHNENSFAPPCLSRFCWNSYPYFNPSFNNVGVSTTVAQ